MAETFSIDSNRGRMSRLADGSVLFWGWTFRAAPNAFAPAMREYPVHVYVRHSRNLVTAELLYAQVGKARLAKDAAKIGRAAVRAHAEQIVAAAIASATPCAIRERVSHQSNTTEEA